MKLLTEKEVAKRLNTSTSTLRRWRSVGIGPPYIRLVLHIRYSESDLEEYLKNRTHLTMTSEGKEV